MESSLSDHFQGKDAINHVAEAQAKRIIASSEIHGTEIPGFISAGADAARETAIILLLIEICLTKLSFPPPQILTLLSFFILGWLIWKAGRGSWLGWSRLERLHRILAQERWEIEHNRLQEREELQALYAAKGFEGKMLEDVVDVLMADGDRLLKIMIEEELGLSLEVHEHPLKQGLGAGLGVFYSGLVAGLLYWMLPSYGLFIAAVGMIGTSAGIAACYEKNRLVPAMIWNLGMGGLAIGSANFFLDYFIERGLTS